MTSAGSKPPLPNVVIAGAPRCGTTSMFSWLVDHPHVAGARVKETYYLMDPEATVKDRGRIARGGLDGYREFFGHVPPGTPVVLEATAGYLYQQTALDTFADRLTDTKLIFLLRRPADRLLSTYHYFSNNWADLDATEIDFDGFVELTRNRDVRLANNDFLREAFHHGIYVDHLRRWADRCGRERIRIVLLEELREEPAAVLKDLAHWLGIDPGFYAGYGFPLRNENYRVRHRGMQRLNHWIRERIPDGALRERLHGLYRKLNTRRPAGPVPAEFAALKRLDAAYAAGNRALAREFDLDLSPWETLRKTD